MISVPQCQSVAFELVKGLGSFLKARLSTQYILVLKASNIQATERFSNI